MTYKVFENIRFANEESDMTVSIHGAHRLYLNVAISSLLKNLEAKRVQVMVDQINKKICLSPSQEENLGYKLYYYGKACSLSIRAIANKLHLDKKTDMPATWDADRKIIEFSYQ